ncbi:hybrid sensor histidine kinase/response regulator [Halopseudomonas salegens]|uniref:Chemotaxis protein CheA n=1 Tax=Halopseudomonas salegens TaxID=1434072 RepID=A0A1H2HAZ5_9GAMM|nr:Hpt domain-containing protein [Halopseudomonas salegens]SDU28728.1 chemosensory pili system protein ChpA (sensor histidine kinase/response regulator) [Halopseudomonas salegens]
MGDRHDYVALDWVKGEISATLQQARQALEAYVAQPDDSTRLRFCLTYIHQVHGTLQMVEFYGAALLAEEMEKLAQAMMHGQASNIDEALEVLMQAILQMPVYLDKVQSGRRDLPMLLLPLLNDMRSARGEKLLSESAVFSAERLEPEAPSDDGLPDFTSEASRQQLRKLRQVLQVAQLGVIRDRDVSANSEQLVKVFARLERLCQGSDWAELWRVFAGIAEGLATGSISNGSSIRQLLRQADRELRQLKDEPASISVPPANELLRNLLFYVAKSPGGSPRLDALKQRYQLQELWKAEDEPASGSRQLVGPDRSAMQSVAQALSEELLQIKDQLDLFVRGDRSSPERLHDLLPTIKQVADTLAMLGLGQPRRVLLEQIEQVERMATGKSNLTDAALMDVAGGILFVEASLHGIAGLSGSKDNADSDVERLASAQDMALVQRQVVQEARNALEQTRDCINAFIINQWDHAQLAPVDDLLTSVRGGLSMLGLERPAAAVNACRRYLLESLVQEGARPQWQALDSLADVVTSIDYYLERLAEDDPERSDSILVVAEERLQDLGFHPAQLPAAAPETPEADAETAPLEEPSAEADASEPESISVEPELSAELPAEAVEDDITEPASGAEDSDDTDLPDAPIAGAAEADTDDDDDLIDPELVEIFVEEAGEVLETLTEFTPQWEADNQDDKACAEVRRAFHTLKGSGRMVQASVLAELAWSVENMLNRVIDRSIELTPAVFSTVNAVRALMPRLVEDFASSQSQMLPEVAQLSAQADALSRGETPLPADEPATEHEQPLEPAEQSPGAEAETDSDAALPVPELDELDELPNDVAEVTSVDDSDSIADVQSDQPDVLPEDTDETPATPELVAPEAGLNELQAAAEADDEEGLDPILLDIFHNETQSHIAQINAFIEQCQQGLPRPISDALQRALHTLKGSAHMAGIAPIADLATPLEKLIKTFKANLVPADQALVDLLSVAVTLFDSGLQQLYSTPQQTIAGSAEFLDQITMLEQQGMQLRDSSRSDLEPGSGPGLMSIFLTEGVDLLLDAADEMQAGNELDHVRTQNSLRALAEVAGDVELPPIERLSEALEQVHHLLQQERLEMTDSVRDALMDGHERLIGMMDQVAAHQLVVPATQEIARLEGLLPRAQLPTIDSEPTAVETPAPPRKDVAGSWHPESAGTDAELVEIFLEEAQEIIDSSASSLQQWGEDTSNTLPVEELQRDLHTLKGGARMAEITPVGDLAHELEFLYEDLCNQRYGANPGLMQLLHACHDSLADMIDGVVAGQAISDGRGLIDSIRRFRADPSQPVTMPDADAQSTTDVTEAAPAAPVGVDPAAGMLGIFLEEAQELLQPCTAWIGSEDEQERAQAKHQIQAVKGGARMAGEQALADQAWALEQALDNAQTDSASLLKQLSDLQERIAALSSGQSPSVAEPADPGPAESAESAPPEPVPASAEPVALQPAEATAPRPASQTLAEVKSILQQAMERTSSGGRSRGATQESVKVPADLLEDLVNLAGETSIFRGRIEQQVSDLGYTLGEMESTIERVRDQLRRLDMETQAQILSRHQEEIEHSYEDFDPLEMDRYSQLQQLSRSLFESASDLFDLKETMAAKARDAETLLLQQARVNTELQEGLMRTRMVPFERLLPRLRRIVRQVSNELGKQVELVVEQADGEMDRSVLERMIGPLEHMLRNAVDHGIELPQQRREAGKAETGLISIDLHREGSEIILSIQDDGAGINLQRIREKALERGLIDADTDLTDQELLDFTLEAGFSTAAKVTQVSGRGVGMDVVNAEVKQLGGGILLHTKAGEGSQITIRLPFTVSVNRALMVYSGDDLYAIPLNTIEGIVRVSGYELEAYYAEDAPPFEYAGKTYELSYLGDLLATGQQPKLTGHTLPLPVILVRGSEHSVAVQVDALAGSREIVVKNLGKQFAVVSGISGATILGDGRVVVILDLLAIIRAQHAQLSQQRLASERAQLERIPEQRATLVMVVDDSITVRKVTSRLLERHGMEVVTAKDGVDAIAKLQDVKPDIMLLDIEMPRMDGFEVATLVRHDEELKELPIVMITSRTGEKHRERAKGIGVNDYLGKPYQESQLLEAIAKLVPERV